MASFGRLRAPACIVRFSCRLFERGLQSLEVGRAEDEAVAGCDVDEVEVDAGPCDLSGEVGEDPGPILDLDDDDFALAAHADV